MTKSINKVDKSKPWEISTDRYVGFIDIMGFKDMLTRRTHEEVYNLMQNVSKSVTSIQAVYSVDYESEADIDINITMILFSDSIMVFTRDAEQHSLENLVAAISALSESFFTDGIPHKGAIAYGKMTLDFKKSIFFGQPLVDAFLLQEELKFYGIVIHGTAEQIGDINEDESVLDYNCPFKNGYAKHLTVAPGVSLTEEFEEKTVDDLVDKVFKFRETTSGVLRKYIDNTFDYLQFVKAEGLSVLKEEEAAAEDEDSSS